MTFVKPFIMCLAAPLVTTLSRLPSRLSWRLPSCLLSCESSPLKSRLWSFITCLAAPVVMNPSHFPPRLSWRLSSRLLSRMSRRPSRHVSCHISRHVSGPISSCLSSPGGVSGYSSSHATSLVPCQVSGSSVSCHASLFFPCPCRVSRNNVSCHIYRHVARCPLAGLFITTLATSLVMTFVASFIIASFISCLEARPATWGTGSPQRQVLGKASGRPAQRSPEGRARMARPGLPANLLQARRGPAGVTVASQGHSLELVFEAGHHKLHVLCARQAMRMMCLTDKCCWRQLSLHQNFRDSRPARNPDGQEAQGPCSGRCLAAHFHGVPLFWVVNVTAKSGGPCLASGTYTGRHRKHKRCSLVHAPRSPGSPSQWSVERWAPITKLPRDLRTPLLKGTSLVMTFILSFIMCLNTPLVTTT